MIARRIRRTVGGLLEKLETRTLFSSFANPDRIEEFSAAALSSTSIQLTWTDNITNEISFRIYRTTDDPTNPATVWKQVVGAPAGTTKWVDRNLTPNTTYYYEISAVTSVGVSEPFPRAISDGINPAEPTEFATTLASDDFAQIDSVTGDLVVRGTNEDDTIAITASGGNIVVTMNALVPLTFPNGALTRIQVFGLNGNDTISIGSVVSATVSLVNIVGGNGNDTITGNDGNDRIDGGNGRDSIDGGIGNDSLFGGGGNDRIFGGADDDLLNGGAGNDRLEGGDGADTLIGGAGHDQLLGQGGLDSLVGDTKHDVLDDVL